MSTSLRSNCGTESREVELTQGELDRRLDALAQTLYQELAEESKLTLISTADLVRRVQPFLSNN